MIYTFFIWVFYIASVAFVCAGFDKMLNYKSPVTDSVSESVLNEGVNAYVGGDAYNYIINSNYAGDYFILALICALVGSTIWIVSELKQSREPNQAE